MTSPARRVALVTGSTSGIGLGIARALAASGADVVLDGFGEAKEVETLRSALEKASPRPSTWCSTRGR